MAGFAFRYRTSGGAPTVQKVLAKNTATYTKGDIVNLATGQVELGATTQTNLLGAVLATQAATAATTLIECITDADAVYGVTDANARKIGDTLDLSGATGAQGVAASTNKEFVVMADSLATEETLIRLNVGKAFNNKAQ